jgi:hypothetical protein
MASCPPRKPVMLDKRRIDRKYPAGGIGDHDAFEGVGKHSGGQF